MKIERLQIKIAKYRGDHLVKMPVLLIKPIQNFRLLQYNRLSQLPAVTDSKHLISRLSQGAVFPFCPLSGRQTAVIIVPIMFQHQFVFRQKNIHILNFQLKNPFPTERKGVCLCDFGE